MWVRALAEQAVSRGEVVLTVSLNIAIRVDFHMRRKKKEKEGS